MVLSRAIKNQDDHRTGFNVSKDCKTEFLILIYAEQHLFLCATNYFPVLYFDWWT